ncbi:MAG: GNAT family N-acetyltransferase [Nitrospira sp.]|nr:MAG: GNAT family N-acetyltransferase [Nitrospira sp.]
MPSFDAFLLHQSELTSSKTKEVPMQIVEEIRPVEFREDRLLVKTLSDDHDLRASYHLRHQVFADRLQWVAKSDDKLEVDSYDAFATSVGLFDEEQSLRGVFRMVSPPYPFMIESEFKPCLLPDYEIRKERDTVEITRLALDPTLTDKGLSIRLMQVLFKGVYQWSMQNEVRYLYMVVEKRFLRVLRGMGFSCEAISPAVSLPPAGTLSIAAVLDWKNFHETCPQKQPSFFQWMNAVDGFSSFEKSGFLARDPREQFAELALAQTRRQDQQSLVERGRRLVAA